MRLIKLGTIAAIAFLSLTPPARASSPQCTTTNSWHVGISEPTSTEISQFQTFARGIGKRAQRCLHKGKSRIVVFMPDTRGIVSKVEAAFPGATKSGRIRYGDLNHSI